jgi:hypothetical protein
LNLARLHAVPHKNEGLPQTAITCTRPIARTQRPANHFDGFPNPHLKPHAYYGTPSLCTILDVRIN